MGRDLTSSQAMLLNLMAGGTALLSAYWLALRNPALGQSSSIAEYRSAEWIRASLPLMLISGLQVINTQAAALMLGTISDPATVGIYAGAAGAWSTSLVVWNSLLIFQVRKKLGVDSTCLGLNRSARNIGI